jgi:hypothetical protein
MLCHYLAVRCLLEARELSEALQVLTDAERDGVLYPNTCTSFNSTTPAGFDEVTPNVSLVNLILTYGIRKMLLYVDLHNLQVYCIVMIE